MDRKQLKVLVLNTSTKVSGAERSLMDILSVFPPYVSPLVVLPDKGELHHLLKPRVQLFTIGLLRLKKTNNLFKLIGYVFEVLRHTRKMSSIVKSQNVDLIYSNSSSSQIYAIFLKLATDKKIVWHVRDNLSNKLISVPFSWFSDKILCISKHVFEQVPFKKRAELMYNGIDANLWRVNQGFFKKIKDELGIDERTLLIAHIGQIIPWKRHDLFVEVANQIIRDEHKNVHFVIIGDDLFNDFPRHQRTLRRTIESYNLGSRISFLSYKDNIIEYLQGIDILLHMADNEPFGRVIIEAMALEKPVVARNQGGPKEIISDDRSGFLVESSDPAVIAKKLKILIDDANLREKFGREGRRIVETNFSISNLTRIGSIISSMK